jgi:hypothetical protein
MNLARAEVGKSIKNVVENRKMQKPKSLVIWVFVMVRGDRFTGPALLLEPKARVDLISLANFKVVQGTCPHGPPMDLFTLMAL